MEVRQQRGLEIAAKSKLQQKGPLWLVPSQSGAGTYVVDRDGAKPTCTCPDFETHGDRCKHVYAVEYTIQRETSKNGHTVTETEGHVSPGVDGVQRRASQREDARGGIAP